MLSINIYRINQYVNLMNHFMYWFLVTCILFLCVFRAFLTILGHFWSEPTIWGVFKILKKSNSKIRELFIFLDAESSRNGLVLLKTLLKTTFKFLKVIWEQNQKILYATSMTRFCAKRWPLVICRLKLNIDLFKLKINKKLCLSRFDKWA